MLRPSRCSSRFVFRSRSGRIGLPEEDEGIDVEPGDAASARVSRFDVDIAKIRARRRLALSLPDRRAVYGRWRMFSMGRLRQFGHACDTF
jgi:C4-type Zn-finger protein